MGEHTPTPWMTQPCGEALPDDVMIVADMGKLPNGMQRISTVARALSIRQTKETTAANAAFIVEAVNNHDRLTRENEAMRKALYAAGNALEMIRLDLIENLTEPERSAFWKAVMYRDKIKAVLSSLKEPTDAQA